MNLLLQDIPLTDPKTNLHCDIRIWNMPIPIPVLMKVRVLWGGGLRDGWMDGTIMTLISDPTDGSEIPRPTTWHVWKPVNNEDIYHISWLAGFLNHQQYDNKSSMNLFYKASELVLECLLEDRHMSMMPRMKLRRRSRRNKPSGPWCQSEEIRTEFNLKKQHLVNKFDV